MANTELTASCFYKKMKSALGELTLIANESNLIAVLWENPHPEQGKFPTLISAPKHPVLVTAEKQLREYFGGSRKSFQLPVEFIGTDFQVKVWSELRTIPYGETRSYGELAKKIKSPKACRAVGAANRRNPLSIVIPCHRVIGINGKLTGFAGGLEAKAFLLDLEKEPT